MVGPGFLSQERSVGPWNPLGIISDIILFSQPFTQKGVQALPT